MIGPDAQRCISPACSPTRKMIKKKNPRQLLTQTSPGGLSPPQPCTTDETLASAKALDLCPRRRAGNGPDGIGWIIEPSCVLWRR